MSTATIEAENFRVNLQAILDAQGAPLHRSIAEQADIHPVTLSRILNGHIVPTMATAAALAKAAGSTLPALLVSPKEFSRKNLQPAIDSK